MPNQEQGKVPHVCLIVGDDTFSAEAAARERIDRFIPPGDQALGLEIIDGRAEIIDEALGGLRRCLEAVRTIGFLGGRKAVWLRTADFLSDPVISRSKDVQDMLQILADTLAGGIPAGHLLIISAPKADARTFFYKACAAHGEIIECELAEKPWQRDRGAMTFALQAFKDAGLQAGHEVVESFVQKVGTDTLSLVQEVAKLATYLGDRHEVREQDIEAVTSSSRDLFAWDLADAVGMRNLPRSLAVLRQLFFQRVEPIPLITGLEGRFRHLLIYREAIDNRWITLQPAGRDFFKVVMADIPEAMAERFQEALATEKGAPMHPFVANKLASQAALFSRAEIDQRRRWILAACSQLVTSSVPGSLILELLVLKLCRPRGKPIQASIHRG